jgi:hypothetical protein
VWSKMVHWTKIKDVAMMHPHAMRCLGNSKDKAKGKGGAKEKKGQRGKPKDDDKDLFSSSKDEDDFDPEERVRAAIALPNVLPLPGFLVVALMDAYTTDAGILCLTAIDATRKSASDRRMEGSARSDLDLESRDRTGKSASRTRQRSRSEHCSQPASGLVGER